MCPDRDPLPMASTLGDGSPLRSLTPSPPLSSRASMADRDD
ncbi:hypothetical protein LINPERPRIM_LOCUS33257 [Linum perenne]